MSLEPRVSLGEIYTAMRRMTRETGYPPTLKELGARVGLSSTATVHAKLRKMEEKGWIERAPRIPRGIRFTRE